MKIISPPLVSFISNIIIHSEHVLIEVGHVRHLLGKGMEWVFGVGAINNPMFDVLTVPQRFKHKSLPLL